MADSVDYTLALATINDIHDAMASLARSIVTALQDGKVSVMEGIQLGMRGMAFATSLTGFIQDGTPADRAMVLYVLEQGHFTMEKS